jgi:hypothetical protein
MGAKPLVAFLLLAGLFQPDVVATGTAHVRVIDRSGAPIRHATVIFIPRDMKLRSGAFPQCITADDGECTQEHLMLAEYSVSASKDDDGYPEIVGWEHMPGLEPVQIQLTEREPTADALLTLAQKGGRLVIHATDAVTGVDIPSFSVLVSDSAHPSDNLSTGNEPGKGLLLPSDEDLVVRVLAPDYAIWKLSAAGAGTGPLLRLRSGETVNLEARLVRRDAR